MTVIQSNEFTLDIERNGGAFVEVGGMEFEIPLDKLLDEVGNIMRFNQDYQRILTKNNFLTFLKSSGLEEWEKYEMLKCDFENIYAPIKWGN